MRTKALAVCLFVLALLPSAYLGWHYRDMPHLGFYHDDALYWVSAKALAQGEGYRILSLPGQPYQTKYPPLYPALLSLIWRIDPAFPGNLPWAMALTWAMLPIFLWLSFHLFRMFGFSRERSWVLIAMLAISPYVLVTSLSLLSELLFASLIMGSVLLAERAAGDGRGWLWAASAGLTAGAAYLTRTAGLPLLLTVPAGLIAMKRGRRLFAFAAGMLPCVVGWNLWVKAHLPLHADPAMLYYTDYAGFRQAYVAVRDLPLLVWRNLDALISSIGDVLFFKSSEFGWGIAVGRILAAAALAGAIRLAWRTRKIQFPLFAVVYLALLLIWHYQPADRLMVPVFPLLLAGFWVETERFCATIRRSLTGPRGMEAAGAGVLAVALVAFAAAIGVRTIDGTLRQWPAILEHKRKEHAADQRAFQWVAQHLPAQASLLAYDDPVVYLFTNRHACRGVLPPMLLYRSDEMGLEKHLRSLGGFVDRHEIGYWLLSRSDWRQELAIAGRQQAQRILRETLPHELLYGSETISVFRIKPKSF